MLAGFFLLAANYHALGMKKPAAWAIAAGLIAFCVYFLAVMAWLGPASLNPAVSQTDVVQINMTEAILSNIGQVLFLLLITHFFQGSMLSTFKQELQGQLSFGDTKHLDRPCRLYRSREHLHAHFERAGPYANGHTQWFSA